jgi:hypothetical protein
MTPAINMTLMLIVVLQMRKGVSLRSNQHDRVRGDALNRFAARRGRA